MMQSKKPWRQCARVAASLDPRMPFEKKLVSVGLDPKCDLQRGCWSYIDFNGANLQECNFTGADLTGALFKNATLTGKFGFARLDQAIVGRVIHRFGRDRHEPAQTTAIADPLEAIDGRDWQVAWKKPDNPTSDAHLPVGAIFRDAPFAPQMVVVPASEFIMGSSPEEITALKKKYHRNDFEAEGPQRLVTISVPFAVGRYPVTYYEWDWAQRHPEWRRYSGLDPREPRDKGRRGRRPVIDVSSIEANAYCSWLTKVTGKTYRLLSEAEWEYCCRGGTATRWSFGNDEKQLGDYAWYFDNSGKKTRIIGKKKPNGFGIYDMHGNVWELCEDNWHENYIGAPTDGSVWKGGNKSLRVVRGGYWNLDPGGIRAASRGKRSTVSNTRSSNHGFRVGRTLSL